MTVNAIDQKITYTGGGVQTDYPFPFRIVEETDIKVALDEVLLTLNVDYTVVAATAPVVGGTVTFTTAPTGDITIWRDLPVTQIYDYIANSRFPSESHEQAMDRQVMILQDLSAAIARAPVRPLSGAQVGSMGTARIADIVDPVNLQDAVTRGYLESYFGSVTAAGAQGPVGPQGLSVLDQTPAELAASVVPANTSILVEGHVARYGAALDGATDDIGAWNDADAVSNAGGAPIYVPKTPLGMAVASTAAVSVGSDVHFEQGAFMLYTGAANEPGLDINSNAANAAFRTYKNIRIRRSVTTDGTNEASVGVRMSNLIACQVDIREVDGFTINVQCVGDSLGFAYNTIFLNQIWNSIVSLNLVTRNAGGFCNENNFIGGRLSNSSSFLTTMNRWGVRLDAEHTTPSAPNSNLFQKQSIEVWDGGTGVARPILINYGLWNRFEQIRDESNDAPFMECQNDAEWNVATVTTNSSSVVSNAGDYDNNFVDPVRGHPFQRQNSAWHSPALHRIANEYDGAGAVYVPGCSQRNSSNGSQTLANTSLTVDDDYLDIISTRGVGVMVDVANIKRFVFRRDVEPGRGGRILVLSYDATGTQLTTAGGYVRGTGSNAIAFTSNFGGGYTTGSDSDGDLFFSITSDVHFIWVGYVGGTASARVRSFALESVDGGALTVFQGYLDANSDPFPNDLQNYAIAVPATAGAGPNYPAGKRLALFNAVAGASPGWVCTTQGLGGVAAFRAEASVAA